MAVGVLLLTIGCRPAGPMVTVPRHARALFFGDSWTNGYSAEPGRGFKDVVAATLGWRVLATPDGSGTGFVHVYPGAADPRTFPERAAALPKRRADVVILEGGVNDVGFDLRNYETSVEKTIETLRSKAGADVPVIVIGPPATVFPSDTSLPKLDLMMSDAARRSGASYISPYGHRWISKSNVQYVIDPTTGHPSTAGHAYIAGRLIDAILALEQP